MMTLASASVLVSVRAEVNDHEAITVELHEMNEIYHLVAYESERIYDVFASLSEGARMLVEMVRAGSRSNVWEAVALHDRQTLPTDQSTRTANRVVRGPAFRPSFVPTLSTYRTGFAGGKPSVLCPSPVLRTVMSFVTEVKVRSRGHNLFGRVSNAVYATYYERARAHFSEEVLDTPLSDPHIVVTHLELNYRAPIESVSTIEVEVEADEPGGKSFLICYTLSYEGEVVVTGEAVQVTMDDEGRLTRVSDQWHEVTADQP